MLTADACLKRIAEREAEVCAFVEVAPSTEAAARGPLHGAGIGIKDLYRVDGFATRAGSALPSELFDGPEADIVRRIRGAGGVVVGKTAMDEFAYCEPPRTKNPLDPRRTPGGSSGGSAAAVAAGMCDFAIGSQTLQSTIVPAAYCGIVGFKPTFGRWPFDGVPLAPSFDTVGFLGRTVEDLTIGVSAVSPGWLRSDRRSSRVGVPARWGRAAHNEGWRRFDAHVEALHAEGIELVPCEVPWNTELASWAAAVGDLVRGEMARVHAEWFLEHSDRYRPRTADAIRRGAVISDDRLVECRSLQSSTMAALDDQMSDLDLDCYASPSAPDAAPVGYDITGDSWMTSFWSYGGLPCVSIPITDDDEQMPRGIQLVGRRNEDEDLVAFALTVEMLLRRRS